MFLLLTVGTTSELTFSVTSKCPSSGRKKLRQKDKESSELAFAALRLVPSPRYFAKTNQVIGSEAEDPDK